MASFGRVALSCPTTYGPPRDASIPAVAFTASVTAADRSRITDAGFVAFLSKPINLKEFLETVKRVVEGGA